MSIRSWSGQSATTGATTDVPLRRYVVVPDESLFLTLAPKPLYANVFVVIPGLYVNLSDDRLC
jgi:hypothetical protein